jgi:hypothetical protein
MFDKIFKHPRRSHVKVLISANKPAFIDCSGNIMPIPMLLISCLFSSGQRYWQLQMVSFVGIKRSHFRAVRLGLPAYRLAVY